MITSLVRLVAAALLVLGVQVADVAANERDGRQRGVAVPAELELPDGHTLFLTGRATGTQNFICLATETGVAWRFTGPQATLFVTLGGYPLQQLTTHFLSPNPGEGGIARPTWQHSLDTSVVWGRLRASSSDPAYVAPGAIPWLLLDVAGAQRGPLGGTLLSRATFIHRVNTAGGLAPANGCVQPSDAGAVALVPYAADYLFYKKSR